MIWVLGVRGAQTRPSGAGHREPATSGRRMADTEDGELYTVAAFTSSRSKTISLSTLVVFASLLVGLVTWAELSGPTR